MFEWPPFYRFRLLFKILKRFFGGSRWVEAPIFGRFFAFFFGPRVIITHDLLFRPFPLGYQLLWAKSGWG